MLISCRPKYCLNLLTKFAQSAFLEVEPMTPLRLARQALTLLLTCAVLLSGIPVVFVPPPGDVNLSAGRLGVAAVVAAPASGVTAQEMLTPTLASPLPTPELRDAERAYNLLLLRWRRHAG